ncbi:Hsp20/alpha crystallin family protein [Janthinobacterium sp. 17J80-10]|uniref:Hsp20/alpha crystallin family protein n=1 Tax=Janthinobacterium sp. 17J80-10 TaxID=2497863 RepID=UPI0010055678|nr:Hsp20/alpha crystallin family protein [Janthinobacterium sp. 17J80-10]QAU34561.1 Hsp20/alpha crystallin family protein [Janthinobacterium sp. 17J80-10]
MAGNLSRFDPFRAMARFDPMQEIEDLFKENRWMPSARRFGGESMLKMDVSETEQAYTVRAEIPGVSKEDIKVAIEGSNVSISAEVKKEHEEKQGENLICSERYYGQQSRHFSLPQDVDETKAEAKYHDGVLELVLPKKTGTGRKQISIQ